MKKLTHSEIVLRQKNVRQEPRLPFCAILNNIRSLYNVGSIFRTADGAGLEKLWLCGITGCPPHAMIAKTALGAENVLPWEYCQNILQLIRRLKNQGYQIALLEQAQGSVLYQDFLPKAPVCLVLGNEITGVTEELAQCSDTCLEIEMKGMKNSLNVAVAFGIAAYHISSRLEAQTRNC